MLLKPTIEQLEQIKQRAVGGRRNDLRDWLRVGAKRIHHSTLLKYLIELTEEQVEYIQAKRLVDRMK